MDRLGGAFDSFDGHDHFDDFVDDGDSHSNPPPSPVGQDERRMQVRAYNHWASLLGNKRLPLIEDLEPEFLGDFGPHSVLLDFSTGSGTPTIQFIGDKLSKECGLYEDIEELNEIPAGSLLSQIADNYLKILSEQAPTGFEAEFVNAKGATVLYRGILLPYSSDSDTLDFVYAVINWKEVADAETADQLLRQIDQALDASNPAKAEKAEEEPLVHNPTPLRKRNPLRLSDPEQVAPEAPVAFEPPAAEAPAEEAYAPTVTDPAYDPEAAVPFEGEEPAFAAAPEADAVPEMPSPALGKKGVDALGNPIGGASDDDHADTDAEQSYGGPMTAADYGLPEWDEEEYEEDDVDEVVNPLADIDLNSRLLSLVNPQARVKKSLDLHGEDETNEELETAQEEEAVESLETNYFAAEEAIDELETEAVEQFEEPAEELYEVAETAVEDAFEGVSEDPVEEVEEAEAEPEIVLEAPEPVEAFEEIEAAAQDVVEADDTDYAEIELDEPAAAIEEMVQEEHAPLDEVAAESEAVEAVAVEAEDEPFELTDAMVEVEAFEEPVAEEDAEQEIVLEAPYPVEAFEEVESFEEEAIDAETEIVLEGPDFAPEPVEVEVAEQAEEAEALPEQPINAAELEDSLAIANQLAQPDAASDAEARKALYDAVRLAYDLASYLREEGNAAVTQDASDSIDALAGQLRELEARDLRDLSIRGPEFALVLVRRGENGELTVLGEVPEEQALVGSAARKLLAR